MTRPIYECRCDERLKTKDERSTRLTYTVFSGGQEHLKIKMRLIVEILASVMGEYAFLECRRPIKKGFKKKSFSCFFLFFL